MDDLDKLHDERMQYARDYISDLEQKWRQYEIDHMAEVNATPCMYKGDKGSVPRPPFIDTAVLDIARLAADKAVLQRQLASVKAERDGLKYDLKCAMKLNVDRNAEADTRRNKIAALAVENARLKVQLAECKADRDAWCDRCANVEHAFGVLQKKHDTLKGDIANMSF